MGTVRLTTTQEEEVVVAIPEADHRMEDHLEVEEVPRAEDTLPPDPHAEEDHQKVTPTVDLLAEDLLVVHQEEEMLETLSTSPTTFRGGTTTFGWK